LAYSIPEDVIEKVRENSDIVEVIGDHLQMKQSGRNYKALCPFHPEKTPSFMVSPEKQIFHCFGCGAGGNVFTFLMKIDGLTFPEAVRALGKRYNIPVPKPAPGHSSETSVAYKINAMAAKAYHAALHATKEGTAATSYLRSRGIDEEIEKAFLLGYAPRAGNLLVLEAKRRKIDESRLQALGLTIERDGEVRDLFRGRLMFPIPSAGGRILGFGGRILDEGQPKYLNSPETRLFNKSEALYGIHRAKNELRARDLAIVVEGYMDVIPLHAHGLANTIASLGTAFTFEQGRRLRRYCSEAVLIYDGDEAGRLAALRACGPAVQGGLKIKVATMPEGHDPDSFIREHGREVLEDLIREAPYYIDFVLAQSPGDDIEDAVRFALGIVAKIGDPIRKALDLKRLAEGSGIPEVMLQASMGRSPAGRGGRGSAGRGAGGRRQGRREAGPGAGPEGTWEGTSEGRDGVSPDSKKEASIPCDKIEKSIISIMVGLPEFADRILGAISPEDFTDRRLRTIAEVILDRKSRQLAIDASAVMSGIEDEAARKVLIDCSVASDITGDPERIVSDHVQFMKRRALKSEIAKLRKRIQIAEKEGDAATLQTLLSKRQSLAEDLKSLST
jgi:DNA primase